MEPIQKKVKRRKLARYHREIKNLAAQLPPMEGHDHLMNMMALFNIHGPAGPKGYIMAIDSILKKIEDGKAQIH